MEDWVVAGCRGGIGWMKTERGLGAAAQRVINAAKKLYVQTGSLIYCRKLAVEISISPFCADSFSRMFCSERSSLPFCLSEVYPKSPPSRRSLPRLIAIASVLFPRQKCYREIFHITHRYQHGTIALTQTGQVTEDEPGDYRGIRALLCVH